MSETKRTGLSAIVVTGELEGKRVNFGNSYDPDFSTTEGQFRALHMKLNRLISLDQFTFESVYEIDGNESVYFSLAEGTVKEIVYVVIMKHATINETLKMAIDNVSKRGGVYTAKRYYEEVTGQLSSSMMDSELADLSYNQAVEILADLTPQDNNILMINQIMQTIAGERLPGIDNNLFENIIKLLENLSSEIDSDIILDSCYSIATQYYEANIFDKAWEIFMKIGSLAQESERLALMISAKLKSAEIARETNQDPNGILSILEEIDDGSLEVASQDEREQYYSMQGYCYERMGEVQMAEDLHYMAVMISESETSPSIYIAESHAFMGKQAGTKYQPEIATREYLTASTISLAKNDRHLATQYSHQAALYELQWAKYLSSTAIIMGTNSDMQNSEFYAWQSMKRLVNAISHSDRTLRKSDILQPALEIIDMNRHIFPDSSEYAINTLNELDNQLNLITDGVLPSDQENELLNFISTKISAMLPLPPPVIMLIANDGRLITGGEIGSERWDENILTNDDLFSGALSAIMAILSEVISGDNPLRMLDAGQTQIMIEKSNVCIGALLVDRDLNIIRKALQDTVKWMATTYPDLEDWDGYSIDFREVKPKVNSLFNKALENITQ